MTTAFRNIALILISQIIFTSLLLGGPDPMVYRYFNKKGVDVIIHRDTLMDRSFRYIETYVDDSKEKDVLIFFLHGAGGGAMTFKKIMADALLLSKANIIALDRPGYLESSPGQALTGIPEQAAFVSKIIDSLDYKKYILVGHSYGAAIMAYYTANHPNKNSKLVMLAPAIDPELETIFPTSKLVKIDFLKEMAPVKKTIAALENLAHQEQLRRISWIWDRLKTPVFHIHGVHDMVIPYQNIYFSKKQIDPKYLHVELWENSGHRLPTFHSDRIINLLNSMIDSFVPES